MATTTDTEEYTRHCDWTDEDRPGMFYVLTTTHGQELVSEDAFRPVDAGVIADLTRQLASLKRRVQQLEHGAGDVDQDDDQEHGDAPTKHDQEHGQDDGQEHGQVAEHTPARAAKVPGQRTRKG